jgi:hypothetical protein
MTCLRPRDSVREIAAFFLNLLRVKGFSTRFPTKQCEEKGISGSVAKQILEEDVYRMITDFLKKEELVRAVDLESAGQEVLPLRIQQRRFYPCSDMCAAAAKSFPRPQPRDESVSIESVNSLTVCFSCCFAKEGYSSMHSVPYLDELREIVLHVLDALGYRPDERMGTDVRHFPEWTDVPELYCLARKTGALNTILRDERKVEHVVSW